MTTTPARRSTRVSKTPSRLAAGSTTPRKRGQSSAAASAFAHPTPASSKRQRTGRGRQAARTKAASGDDEEAAAGASSEEEEKVEEAPASSGNESVSDSEPASDFEQPRSRAPRTPRTPRRAGRRSAAGGTANARKTKAARAAAAAADSGATGDEPSQLLEALLDDKAAVAQVAMDWIESYGDDADAALCELINFVIRLTGCRGRITTEALYETDGIAGVLEGLQEQTIAALKRREADADADDLLLGRTKEQRRLRKSALQMVQQLV
ncbi:cohesin complex subunit, partial [Coemansia helicoidea]